MSIQLVVVRGFGPHLKGDRISNPADIAAILAGENADKVVNILVPSPQPTPAPTPKPQAAPASVSAPAPSPVPAAAPEA